MSVAKLQTVSLITPPGAVMLGWAVGGEKFSLSSLLAACFVLAGVWMIFRKAEVIKRVTRQPDESAALPRG
jgi:drug/metabolite transporter (DMT)-like permease